MITQHLHRYVYLWRKCTEGKTIVLAWKKLRKGKTRRREVRVIESDFPYFVNKMREELLNTRPGGDPLKMFTPEKRKPKYIKEHGKIREIYCPSIWEQWVHHIIVYVLTPIIMKSSYPYSCGSMPKRGGVYGKNRLSKIINQKGFKYFLKLDIRHFFNSVHIKYVIDKLHKLTDDDWFDFLLLRVYMFYQDKLPLLRLGQLLHFHPFEPR